MRRFFAERDPEYPCWYYPWNDMDRVGDYFILEEPTKDVEETFKRLKTLVNNVEKRRAHMHKSFDVSFTEDRKGVRVTLINI